jgi:hypothetical protein
MKLALIIALLCLVNSLSAQQVKERIAWVKYDGSEKRVDQKRSIKYNKAGEILSVHFKQPDNDPEFNFDRMEERNAYDDEGRLILAEEFSRDGSPYDRQVYDYNTNKGYYTITHFDYDSKKSNYVSHCYTNEKGAVVERKSFEIDTLTGTKTLSFWQFYSYSKDGRFIGKRYKTKQLNIFPIPAKMVCKYIPGTDKLLTILNYAWNAEETADTILTSSCVHYIYNKKGQLIRKEVGSKVGYESNTVTTYQYKAGKIWIEQKSSGPTPRMKDYRTVKIYKNGVLVREKDYNFHYRPEQDSTDLGEQALESVTNYQYIYYKE